MNKKILGALIIVMVCSCTGIRRYNISPNYESLLKPRIYQYLKKDNKDLDNAIDSLLSIENNEDIHIWLERPNGKTRIRIIATKKECLTMEFIDAPELVGYCKYKGHICYIYMDNGKEGQCDIFHSLFVRTQSFLLYDSIYCSKIKSDCNASERVFYYERD